MQSIVNSTDFRISKKIKENDKEICKRIYIILQRGEVRGKKQNSKRKEKNCKGEESSR